MTAATSSPTEGTTVTPPSTGTTSSTKPSPVANVRSVCTYRRSRASDTSTRPRRVAPTAMYTASTIEVAPSYREAFDTSSPVSSQIIDWYSNRDCSTPWDSSGWYGVYEVY